MANSIRSTRLGPTSAGNIEPSCGVFDIMDGSTIVHRIVVDCGLSPHGDINGVKTELAPDFSIFDDGKKIDLVFLTHVHLDHAGAMPALVRWFSDDTLVVMSKTSARMLPTVLLDGLAINAKRETIASYSDVEYEQLMQHVTEIDRPGEYELLPGVFVLIHPAGHMPGACSYTVRIDKCHVHFAGDRCEHNQPGTLGATLIPTEWRTNLHIFGIDGTYGADHDSDKRVRELELNKAIAAGAQAIAKGAPAFYPTFATRGHMVAHELQRMNLPDYGNVYLDGSCRTYANIVGQTKNHWAPNDELVNIDRIMRIQEMTNEQLTGEKQRGRDKPSAQKHREAIVHRGGGYAVIGTSGMGGPGVSTFWRRQVLENRHAAMIFTGFLAPDSNGYEIYAAARRREAGGSARVTFQVETNYNGKRHVEDETYDVLCNVVQCRLGAHDSRKATLDWFERMGPTSTVLNHGSPEALESLASSLSSLRGLQGIYPCHTTPSVTISL